jgi:hypothetical protein
MTHSQGRPISNEPLPSSSSGPNFPQCYQFDKASNHCTITATMLMSQKFLSPEKQTQIIDINLDDLRFANNRLNIRPASAAK